MNKLLLLPLTALLLASCNSQNTTPPTNTTPAIKFPAITSLNGTVVENGATWTGGVGTVKLSSLGMKDEVLLASTILNVDGTFSFATLPIPDDANLDLFTATQVLPSECTSTLTSSDPLLKFTDVSLSVEAKVIGPIKFISSDTAAKTESFGTFIYADRNSTLKGTQTCAFGTQKSSNTFDVQLVEGWNAVVTINKSDTNTSTMLSESRNGSPARAQWEFFGRTPTATPLSANHLLR
ncbi:hypothetical protein [Deinococcus sp.]|uniref:hypothetical protein n=1 Tax=Deinococcus sp. TaxID=47478 RepID=UPI003B5C1CA1